MKIGLDLRMANVDYGIGRYSFELAKNILALDRSNDYILFVRDAEKFQSAGFPLYKNCAVVHADFRHYSLDEQFRFPVLISLHKPDLIHFMNFNVPVMYGKPFVVTIHDVVHHKLPGNKPSRFLHRFAYKFIISKAASGAKKIITVSNASKQEIMETLRVPAQKIDVVYEATEQVAVNDSELLAVKQKYSISKPYIIFVGVMERKKNTVSLSRAFDILKEKYKMNIQLVMVGKEDRHYPEIMEQTKSIKYSKDLIFTGVVSDKEKFALYKGAEAFVSASLYEGFGLPGVEAMSVGTPLAVSNTSVFNEVYDNGAIYFEPRNPEDIAQKISLLLNDRKYRQVVSNNAYVRAQLFSWQKAAKETIAVYMGALDL